MSSTIHLWDSLLEGEVTRLPQLYRNITDLQIDRTQDGGLIRRALMSEVTQLQRTNMTTHSWGNLKNSTFRSKIFSLKNTQRKTYTSKGKILVTNKTCLQNSVRKERAQWKCISHYLGSNHFTYIDLDIFQVNSFTNDTYLKNCDFFNVRRIYLMCSENSILLRILLVTKCKEETEPNCHEERGLLNDSHDWTSQRWVSSQAWCSCDLRRDCAFPVSPSVVLHARSS